MLRYFVEPREVAIVFRIEDLPPELRRAFANELNRKEQFQSEPHLQNGKPSESSPESKTLDEEIFRQLYAGVDSTAQKFLRTIVDELDADGIAYVSCEIASAIDDSGQIGIEKGTIPGIHRRLRSVSNDKSAKLIFKYKGNIYNKSDCDTYYIDNSKTIAAMRRVLGTKENMEVKVIHKDVEITWYGVEGSEITRSAEVRMDARSIAVSYMYDDTRQTYTGTEIGIGHYELTMEGGNGKASLHCFPDDDRFVGSWSQDGEAGTWEITLEV